MTEPKWNEILDNYGYPKMPCDAGCMDRCPARADCPLYQAWVNRTKEDG